VNLKKLRKLIRNPRAFVRDAYRKFVDPTYVKKKSPSRKKKPRRRLPATVYFEPDYTEQLIEARAHLTAGRISLCREIVYRLREHYGSTRGIEELLHKLCRASGEEDEALKSLSRLIMLETDPVRLEKVYYRKADYLIETGERKRATQLLEGMRAAKADMTWLRHLRYAIEPTDSFDFYEKYIFKNLLDPTQQNDLKTLNHYSAVLRDLGEQELMFAASRARFIRAVRGHLFKKTPKKVKKDWLEDAKVALADLKEDLDAAGIKFFLVSGTLLGCVREGGILGHDKDIDVGVDESVDAATIRNALRQSGRFIIRKIDIDEGVYVKHQNGVMIDVFRHFMKDGQYIHQGVKVYWWNTPFNLVEHDFLDSKYLIPENYDLYLQENYGDWRTPAPEFETFVDTPNMVITDHDQMIWYYYTKLTDYYLEGKIPQFKRVFYALENMQKLDAIMLRCINIVLERHDKAPPPTLEDAPDQTASDLTGQSDAAPPNEPGDDPAAPKTPILNPV
jgi:hypothetical protein